MTEMRMVDMAPKIYTVEDYRKMNLDKYKFVLEKQVEDFYSKYLPELNNLQELYMIADFESNPIIKGDPNEYSNIIHRFYVFYINEIYRPFSLGILYNKNIKRDDYIESLDKTIFDDLNYLKYEDVIELLNGKNNVPGNIINTLDFFGKDEINTKDREKILREMGFLAFKGFVIMVRDELEKYY